MTHRNRVRLSKLSLALVAVLAAAPAFAQSTSAGVVGHVVGADGQPVAGAEVTITHTESGTVSHATTDANGNYSSRGLRVGGPYTITINKAGTGVSTQENVYLELNQVADIDSTLNGDVATLGSVQVVGSGADIFSSEHKGVSTSVSGRQLETAASASRTMDEIARLDPRITVIDSTDGSISLAGVNSRFNSIKVDGLEQGDPFGLNSNGMPYTGSPISPDSIAAYDISASDYDVTADAIGANINAVTKSGTNDFHGSLYTTYKNAGSMVGEFNGGDYPAFDTDRTYGFSLGGPILKDKLFFYLSAEQQKVTGIGNQPSNGYTNHNVSDADLDTVEAAAQKWGLVAGTSPRDSSALTLDNKRYLGKLDWNISDSQRASLTYQLTKETKPNPYDTGSNRVVYSSHYYDVSSETENVALQLFSDWSENFSTEAKISHQTFDQLAGNPLNQPHIQVNTASGTIYLGEDQFRAENEIHTKKLNASLVGTWYAGDHAVKGGFEYLRQDNFDLFGRQLHGVFLFNSPTDFLNGNYQTYSRTLIPSGFELSDMGFPMQYSQWVPFLQDTWQATDQLSLTYGVRVVIPHTDRAPDSLTGATADAYESVVGFANNQQLGADNKLIEPRFGFNYQFDTERASQLRGGIGLFQTQPPTVWVFNPYQNNGVSGLVSTNSTGGESFDQLITDVENKSTSAALAGRPQVDAISPDFRLPSAWKFTLGYDMELPWWGVTFSADYLYIKNKDAIWYTEPNTGIGSIAGATPVTLPDGRTGYWTNGLPSSNAYRNSAGVQTCYVSQTCNGTYVANNAAFAYNSTVLGNTDKGYSRSLTFALSKPFVNGWSADVSTTFAKATEVNPGNSSQATSNYQIAMVEPNGEVASIADRSIEASLKASLTWEHAFFGDNKTTISVFYNGHTGQPYSWVFGTGSGIVGDVNGDNQAGYDLAYIPNVNDTNVAYVYGNGNTPATAAQIDAFNAYIDGDRYLSGHRGEIADRNGAHSPWANTLDLGIQQELPGFAKGHHFVVRMDVNNVLNMLNKDWGQVETVNTFNPRRNLAYVSGFTADGKYKYDLSRTPQNLVTWYTSGGQLAPSRVSSLWSALLTVKYEF